MPIIQTGYLIEANDQVIIPPGSDCKFYRVVALQLCKFTDEAGGVKRHFS